MQIQYIPTTNCNRRTKPINMLVFHFTAGGSIASSIKWFQDPTSKASAHYLVERDGTIVQMVEDADRAWHAGQSEWQKETDLNSCSIGIEICNWGQLQFRNNKFWCWPKNWGVEYRGPAPFKDAQGNHWEPYTKPQLDACIHLSTHLVSTYQIPKDRVLGHSDIAPGRKTDPGPAFPWDLIRLNLYPPPVAEMVITEPMAITASPAELKEHQGDRSTEGKKKPFITRWLGKKFQC